MDAAAYVRRTGEPVLIDDTCGPTPSPAMASCCAARPAPCSACPCAARRSSTGCSTWRTRSPPRPSPRALELLGHIASQAAISIENARLYTDLQKAESALRQANEELERRVDERTRELTHAQSQLVETARMVGMAEVATNVLHDVGNALTSIVVDSGLMRQSLSASRLSRLKRVAALLEEHRHNLPRFFTRDPRGSHLVDYLTGLAQELAQEQTALQGTLEDMNKNVSRVRAIIQMQQTYATSTVLPEECELDDLLDDALRLHQGALERAGIQVTREVKPLPRVKVDRYKVLQILFNLFSNACHALETQPPGQRRLEVRLEPRAGVGAHPGEWTAAWESLPRCCPGCSTRGSPPARTGRGLACTPARSRPSCWAPG